MHKQLNDTNRILPPGQAPPSECRKGQKDQEEGSQIHDNDALYKRGFSMSYLKSVDEDEAKYILEEIHEGICGDHASPRSLVSKVIRTGYFWPTMQVDAMELVKKCDKCQRYGNVQRLPVERMMTIASSWPFAQWGIDIIGPLPQGKG